MWSTSIRRIYKKYHLINIGYGTYGGIFNRRNVPRNTTIGNYCSVAPNIRIFNANHPKEQFTLHPLFYNPKAGFVKDDRLTRSKLIIGNDVWIGEWVIILPSCTHIGDGSIIGAGSVVTKNVPEYSIVVGNPAKVISRRFDPKAMAFLKLSKWWELDKDELSKNEMKFNSINP
ncbi:MAG: CatB-related O-acetyltransferase [Melioribacteraceae bacterium]|nr:CatB-related O-acetyltransferase [Melioribacteraceae bacterium]MCF8263498.1 CatB-related O-acetyltransferase [Melioribacteraceae bacterium]MCF8296948.1 CatB-related O-acetyltransferase [Saprospiraceae bacterium]